MPSVLFKIRNRRPVQGLISNVQLCSALSNKLKVVCTYRDEQERVLEPHCHGHSHDGNEVLSAYQEGCGWKMFSVSDLVVIRLTSDTFVPRQDFNAEAPGMSQIHCKV